MAKFRFSNDIFLALQELNFLRDSLDRDGFRRHILENSTKFGLIKTSAIPEFTNGKVEQDTDVGSEKSIKISPIAGIDRDGNFITSEEEIRQLVIPNDGLFRWAKVKYAPSKKERGTCTIDASGNVTGSSTDFLQCRGIPGFASKIRFFNAVDNTLEYMVHSVIDSEHMVLQNPAADVGSVAQFAVESDLTWGIVGTHTAGLAIPSGDKFPFEHDSVEVTLELETTLNTPPASVENVEFFLARVSCLFGNLKIQDKRGLNIYETKGSELAISIDRNPNPLIGVEAVKWQVPFSPADKNIVEVGFSFRSANWSINSNTNVLTLASGLGGKFKSVADFTDGDFDGWRVYTGNGKYSYVISSYKLSGAINLLLDTLDVDNYSSDGGSTMLDQTVVIAPDCEEVAFWCQAHNADGVPSVSVTAVFPIYHAVGKIELECYKDPSCSYNIQYSYKSFKECTEWRLLPSDTVNGYLNENSFDSSGNLDTPSRTTYTAAAGVGFITLTLASYAYHNFSTASYKGDKIEMANLPALFSNPAQTFVVGIDPWVQRLTGSHTLSGDTTLTLDTAGAQNLNVFTFIFDFSSLNLAGFTLRWKVGISTIFDFTQSDIYEVLNSRQGVKIEFRYNGTTWIPTANYTPAPLGSIVTLDGVIADMFDVSGGVNNALGKIKSLYGYSLCNFSGTVNSISVPNLAFKFVLGAGDDGAGNVAAVGDTGGSVEEVLDTTMIPSHTHTFSAASHSHTFSSPPHSHTFTGILHGHNLKYYYMGVTGGGSGAIGIVDGDSSSATNATVPADDPNFTSVVSTTAGGTNSNETVTGTNSNETVSGTNSNTGGGLAHNNMSPYYALIFAKKCF